ncbi:MAG: hypothetical protein STHCBS139747_003374 [Sporothrix thermara]
MTITLYEVSIGTFKKALSVLKHILEKSVEHATAQGVDPNDYVQARLCEDMLPLSFQVQTASNIIKKSLWRVYGDEVPIWAESWADDETTMEQLIARVQRTLDALEVVDKASLNSREEQKFDLAMGRHGTHNLSAKFYMLNYALPNVYFHVQTAYAILRSKNVPLGKMDYLNIYLKQ